MNTVRIGIVSMAATVALAGCSGTQAKDTDDSGPFRIMLTAGTSSPMVDYANTSIIATKAAVAKVNEEGGVGGRKVELTVVDDGADPTKAVTALREAIASGEAPDVYLNSGPSTIPAATLPVLAESEILSFNIAPTEESADPAKFPLNFNLSPSIESQANGLTAQVQKASYSKVAIMHGATATGEEFAEQVRSTLADAGIEVTGTESYDPEGLDFVAQLQALESTSPEALIIDAYGAPLGYILQGMKRLGWSIPQLGNLSVAATSLVYTEPPEGLVGTADVRNLGMLVFGSTQFDPEDDRVNEMVDDMAAIGTMKVTLINALNCDAPFLIRAAAEHADSTDAEALADALEDPEVQEAADTAAVARYGWTDESHAFVLDGDDMELVEPSLLRNGQFGNPAVK